MEKLLNHHNHLLILQKNFQMINEMSYNDLITIGPSLGFSDTLDNHRSVKWNGTTATANGMGFTNNKPLLQMQRPQADLIKK